MGSCAVVGAVYLSTWKGLGGGLTSSRRHPQSLVGEERDCWASSKTQMDTTAPRLDSVVKLLEVQKPPLLEGGLNLQRLGSSALIPDV